MKKYEKYYLGLDMGTTSVGWAVTDENYNLCRAKGKDMWGIREFDEASTAVDRRTHRVSRRRRQREVARIGLLKNFFEEEINKVDKNFYQRLENSKYYFEDKDDVVKSKNGIFNDANYTDEDYYKDYPTIFHLRKELLESDKKMDVRFLYLALLNMYKHRGHFLNASLGSEESSRNINEVYADLKDRTKLLFDYELKNDIDGEEFISIISNREYSRTKKSEELQLLFDVDKKNKFVVNILKGLCGLKFDINLLYKDIVEFEDNVKLSLSFADFKYEELALDVMDVIGEEYFEIINIMKEIYDIASLASVLKNHTYLSQARVEAYDKHHEDLRILKQLIKKYCTHEQYNAFFRDYEDGSYSAYVNSSNSKEKNRRNIKKRRVEELYTSIKKLLNNMDATDKDVIYVRTEIENENFLLKQLTNSNGIIPYQVHLKEMKKILNNAEKHMAFLKNVDETGLTIKEKIIKVFEFQIPYYIGPVTTNSEKNNGNGWVVRKEEGKVLPWNIEQKIDIKATNEAFISKMVRECTYLTGQKVLPKCSLMYESFRVLNEINNIKIAGEKIPVHIKQGMYNELFSKGKKVTKTKVCDYLEIKGLLATIDRDKVSGIDNVLANTLSTYAKFYAVLGDNINKDYYKKMVEDIVFWSTVYGDSKKLIKDRIKEYYPDVLSEKELKRILGFKFNDWGRLSKEFLTLKGVSKETGEELSLIRSMWETNDNLMEILNESNYTYKEELELMYKDAYKVLSELKAEDLDEMYFSAPVKRMVWQTLLIIREISGIMGKEPDKVFIEMTRTSEEKVRTKSRKDFFLDLYKSIKDEEQDWKKLIESEDKSGRLRSKKMYLYLTQKGRCMYTGKRIELDDLFNDNLYDIDHIYPRHYVKDDNIANNLVLVDKKENAHKSDFYPIEEKIYNERIAMWRELKNGKLITEEKFHRLTNRNEFSNEQKADFIARQLVETRQGTKGVATLLKSALKNSKIVYAKASNVSEFRRKFNIPKSRLVNDFHHAHDAYLNIVVGNVYLVKFTENPRNFIDNIYEMDKKNNHYNLSKMFDWTVERGNEVAWIASDKDEKNGTIVTVKKMLKKNTPLLTRRCFEAHGGIADQTLYGASKAKVDSYIPIKEKDIKMQDITKYGGFSSVSTAYFILVEHEEKGKRIRTLETVPIMYSEMVEHGILDLEKYCSEKLYLINPKVLIRKIRLQSLLERNGYLMHISGKTNNQIGVRNAIQMKLQMEDIEYIKLIEKYVEYGNKDERIDKKNNIKIFDKIVKKHTETIFKNRPNPIGGLLNDAKDKFDKLNEEEQMEVIYQILQLSVVGVTSADLRLIGGAKIAGKMLISKNITNSEKIFLIHQSLTGLYEKKVDLLSDELENSSNI